MLKCSLKVPPTQRANVSECFHRGVRVGIKVGIEKQKINQKRIIKKVKKRLEKKKKAIEASAQALVFSKFKSIPLRQATNNQRKSMLKELGVPYYQNMSEAQTITELQNRGYASVVVPRVR